MYKRSFYALIIIFISLCTSGQAFSSIDLTFGVYTSNKPTAMIAKFRPLLNVLENDLSELLNEKVNIRLKIAKSYEQGRRHLLQGEVDFSRFGPVSYVMAKDQKPAISILAIESNHGLAHFKGVIAIHGDSKLTGIEQLQGKSFAFGNETSTIGRYLSQLYLYEHGIHAQDLASYKYLGRHDKVGMMVAYGHYDAGALNEKTYEQLLKKGKNLKVLASFSCPTKPWLARSGLPVEIKNALTSALLNFKDEKVLQKLKYQGFLTVDDSHYDVVRTAIKRNSEFFMKEK